MPPSRLKALKDFLEDARARVDPAEALPHAPRDRRRARGLTQEEVNYAIRWGSGAYQALISGRNDKPTEPFLRDLARLFRFTEQQWTALWNLALGEAPPSPLHRDAGSTIPAAWAELIRSAGHICYATNRAWDVLAWSKAFGAIYEGREWPENMMRWMLLSDDARGNPDRPELTPILTDWANSWAPYVLPQLRAARARFPHDDTLAAIEADVQADPLTGPMYEAREHATVHPDGAVRPQWHPRGGRDRTGAHGWVQICAAEPLGATGARVMGVIWTPGDKPGTDTLPVAS